MVTYFLVLARLHFLKCLQNHGEPLLRKNMKTYALLKIFNIDLPLLWYSPQCHPIKGIRSYFVEKCRENYTFTSSFCGLLMVCESVKGDCAEGSIWTRIATSCLHFSFLLISFFPFSSLLQPPRLKVSTHFGQEDQWFLLLVASSHLAATMISFLRVPEHSGSCLSLRLL